MFELIQVHLGDFYDFSGDKIIVNGTKFSIVHDQKLK